ncbi:hypothetical protein RP20_CCG024945 [Aedes albopictus]|nr:hypothetical protein RP20_CCG024945 [Aedes albopictus]
MLLAFFALSAPLVAVLIWLQFRYWTRCGVPQLDPSFPFGNFSEFFCQKNGIPSTYANLYHRTKHLPYVGIYLSLRPALLINDPELVKNILTRDFEHFHDRGIHVDEETDPMSGHLFALGGVKWKNLRAKLTPTFSSGSLKEMFPLLVEKANILQRRFLQEIASSEVVEVKELAACYTSDVIASVAYGIDMDSINNRDDLFRRMGEKVLAHDLITSLRLALAFWFPKLKVMLGSKSIAPVIQEFMTELVRKTIEHREKEGVHRKDMMQLLLQLRNGVSLKRNGEQWTEDSAPKNPIKSLSIDEVTAQVMVFFVAGYETSSSTVSFCLFELARHQDIQAKVHQEIDSVLAQHEGALTYCSLASMKYVEQCLEETVRKYPPVAILNRECTKTYRIPETDVTIEKGTPIVVPLMGMHRDPEYFPQPNDFQPERFEGGAPSKAYFGFGAGPRLCIGMRLGILQSKVAVVTLLRKFHFSLANPEDQCNELRMKPRSFILTTEGGIQLVVQQRHVETA